MKPETTTATAAAEQERSGAEPTRTDRYYRPAVDIIERADELTIVADMPGVTADRVDIKFEEGALTIHGRVPPRQDKDTRFLQVEYGVGDFFRVFQVSEQVDSTRIEAECSDGVLTVHLPKTEAARPRKIAVQPR